ncbi:UNVERIFIED_CONTAM: hypothetical protein GTU68_037127 [Idotea baltica]|nr:hypothetical protein [Idotea baltica]
MASWTSTLATSSTTRRKRKGARPRAPTKCSSLMDECRRWTTWLMTRATTRESPSKERPSSPTADRSNPGVRILRDSLSTCE